MKALLVCVWLSAAISARGDDVHYQSKSLRSFDGLFEVYETPGWIDKDVNGKSIASGTKLFLRSTGKKTQVVLLCENARWMEEKWCPTTHLLGVADYFDGHQSDVYVYEVDFVPGGRAIHFKLVFKSPWSDYDRVWSIEGWEPKARAIRLKLEQRGNDDIVGHESWPPYVERHLTMRIGTKPLSDSR